MDARVGSATFLLARVCTLRAWWHHREDPQPLAPDHEQREQLAARALAQFPDSTMIDSTNVETALKESRSALSDPNAKTILNAVVKWRALIARIDILVAQPDGGFQQILVGAAKDTVPKKRLRDLTHPLAVSAMVLSDLGLRVHSSLFLVSHRYRKGMDDDQLFTDIDRTQPAMTLGQQLHTSANSLIDEIVSESPPTARLVPGCRDCPYYVERCLGKGVAYPVAYLPYVGADKLMALDQAGVRDVADIPEELEWSDAQDVMIQAVKKAQPWMDEGLPAQVRALKEPRACLDMETELVAMPVEDDARPFESHVKSASVQWNTATEISHADEDRREHDLIVKVVQATAAAATVVVYGDAVPRALRRLSRRHEDLASPLEALTEKIVDLRELVVAGFYHQDFHGSYSLHRVAEALGIPDQAPPATAIASVLEAIEGWGGPTDE